MKTVKNTASDDELVSQFLAGNSEALGIVFERYHRSIAYSLARKINSSEIINDILQDTYLKAIEQIAKGAYRNDGKMINWLDRIANNLLIDYFRKKNRDPYFIQVHTADEPRSDTYDSSIRYLIDWEKNPEEKIIGQETKHEVRRLVSALPDNLKHVVQMRYDFGFSFNEIAFYSDVSVGTACGRMRYALAHLRKKIA